MLKHLFLLCLFIGICFAYSESSSSLYFAEADEFELQKFKAFKKAVKKISRPSKNKNDKSKGEFCDVKRSSKSDIAAQVGGKVAGKVASKVASAVFGPMGGAVVGGITMALGFIGDAVQRNKCKLGCCPKKGLKGSWACKYQTKETCNGFYSDYPGHGDHACWWNMALQRCEVGDVCRDKTFNFFALVGSTCPKCPDRPCTEPQWGPEALKKAGLPKKFYVDPNDEYVWCAPRGSKGRCKSNKTKAKCEISYADHWGDKNCIWRNGKCTEGRKCDNARERVKAAKKLGLTFERSAWRRNGVPISGENYNHDENRRLVKNNLMGILENKKFQNCVNSCKHGQDVTSTCVKSCVKLVPLQ